MNLLFACGIAEIALGVFFVAMGVFAISNS
jgi:hypothetical protein